MTECRLALGRAKERCTARYCRCHVIRLEQYTSRHPCHRAIADDFLSCTLTRMHQRAMGTPGRKRYIVDIERQARTCGVAPDNRCERLAEPCGTLRGSRTFVPRRPTSRACTPEPPFRTARRGEEAQRSARYHRIYHCPRHFQRGLFVRTWSRRVRRHGQSLL